MENPRQEMHNLGDHDHDHVDHRDPVDHIEHRDHSNQQQSHDDPPSAHGMKPSSQRETDHLMDHSIHQAMHHNAKSDNHVGMQHAVQSSKHSDMHHRHGMSHDMNDPSMAAMMERDIRNRFWIALGLTVAVVLLSPMADMFGIGFDLPVHTRSWLLLVLTTPVVFYSGWMFISGAYHALRAKRLDMAVLIVTGVLAAYLASAYLTFIGSSELFYEAAAMLVTFVLFGHWMEMKSRKGTNEALKELFKLIPPTARVLRDATEQEIPSDQVVRGDKVLLRPGERIPVDGVVISGSSAVDEALVTGESVPVPKKEGDQVVGGSINGNGALTIEATAVGEEATLSRIAKLVETAQNSKAPGQRIADRAAAYLVVLAVGAGIVTFLAWYLWAGAPFVTALTFAISAVVIACPDALGLATPTAVAVGTGLGAKHHILIKDAATLEGASKINAVILDKTGTLTEGKPRVTDLIITGTLGEEQALSLMVALEAQSGHPLALAVIAEAEKRKAKATADVQNFESVTGQGLKASVGGKTVLLGNARLMNEYKVPMSSVPNDAKQLLTSAKTIMLLAVDGTLEAVVGITDPIKASAKRAISELKKIGIETAILSGDNKQVVDAVARELGVDRAFAEVLPETKADYVKKLQAEGKFVAMVGDGVNDAPALAQSDIGIAIGAGTNVATEAGKIILMQSDPLDILNAIMLSKATVRKMKQNLVWASVYNLLAIPVAAGAFYSWLGWTLRPEISALLMSASSIIVATNAVMLRSAEHKLIRNNA